MFEDWIEKTILPALSIWPCVLGVVDASEKNKQLG
jgi:hypothetical protein